MTNVEFFGGIEPCDLDCNCVSSGTASGWPYTFISEGNGEGKGYADGAEEAWGV